MYLKYCCLILCMFVFVSIHLSLCFWMYIHIKINEIKQNQTWTKSNSNILNTFTNIWGAVANVGYKMAKESEVSCRSVMNRRFTVVLGYFMLGVRQIFFRCWRWRSMSCEEEVTLFVRYAAEGRIKGDGLWWRSRRRGGHVMVRCVYRRSEVEGCYRLLFLWGRSDGRGCVVGREERLKVVVLGVG